MGMTCGCERCSMTKHQDIAKAQLLKSRLGSCTLPRVLRELEDLTGQSLGDTGALLLADAMKGNSSLRILSLRWNGIKERGAAAIAAALQVSHVRCLDLYCNSFGDSGATHVAQAANSCNSLRELDLGWNSVCDPGAAAIATCLMQNQTLLELGLEQNAIGENGAKALAAALQQNHSLIKLRLRGNPLQGGFELKASGRLDLTERSTARASLSSEPEAEGSAQATRPSARNGKKSGRLHVGLALALAWT
ncbi:unnamed protein product [Effrenium voratum]|nr:unnamed protein product [Effrenium voratum]